MQSNSALASGPAPAPTPAAGQAALHLPIAGMSCAACVSRVEKAIAKVPGVAAVSVNGATDTARLTLATADAAAAVQAVAAAVAKAGYGVPVQTRRLAIDGMSCASCVGRIEKALARLPGVQAVTVNLATNSAQVQRLAGTADDATLLAAVQAAGYQATLAEDGSGPAPARSQGGWQVAAAALLSAPLVLPMLGDLAGRHWMLAPLWQWLLATPVLFGFGWRFFRGGWAALRQGTGNMDLLVATGTSAAYGLSLALWAPWRADPPAMPHLYFESAAVVVTLVLFGKWLEARAKRRTLGALDALRALRPDTARLWRDGAETTVPLAQLQPGDLVVVRPGERLPADGEVAEGRSHLDESLVTGESLPVARGPGDRVTGGALNGEGRLLVRATAVGSASLLAQIVQMVESAQARKPAIQQTVDRVAAVFVPVVFGIALLTLLGWRFGAAVPWGEALIHAVSVLVIACPCALGLATPATLVVGTGLAARRGMLVRDAQALELLRDVAVVAFDKTGTLTEGKPVLAQAQPAPGLDRATLLRLAAALQQGSEHPLARAVLAAAAAQGLQPLPAQALQAVPGRGIAGTAEGRSLHLGSGAWMQALGLVDAAAGQPLAQQAAAWAAQGYSVSWLAELPAAAAAQAGAAVPKAGAAAPAPDAGPPATAARALGLLAFGDSPKPDAAAGVAALQQLGVRVVLLSGDNRGAAQAMAARVGIAAAEVQAEVLPGDKARAVGALKQGLPPGARVAMVGDGVNDAPALAAADIGIAMAHADGGGTDVAMQTAGLTLLRGNPALVAEGVLLSRAVTRRIRLNLFWAFAYNVVGIPLAALGLLSPMVAGAAMALSSISVVTSALLLARWRPPAR